MQEDLLVHLQVFSRKMSVYRVYQDVHILLIIGAQSS